MYSLGVIIMSMFESLFFRAAVRLHSWGGRFHRRLHMKQFRLSSHKVLSGFSNAFLGQINQ
ncbi:MAG TPA: hypothetical protein G4O13_07785 [Dehalococcoidia bacterium]|nr:hypothetical protein [Dehalococcoidia bacterium]